MGEEFNGLQKQMPSGSRFLKKMYSVVQWGKKNQFFTKMGYHSLSHPHQKNIVLA